MLPIANRARPADWHRGCYEPLAMIDGLFSSNSYAGSKNLLDATVMRHEALAGNIANVETPGYKRVDLAPDFAAKFAEQLRAGEKTSTAPTLQHDASALSQRADGNNVTLDQELLALGKNQTEFDTLTEFVSGSLRQLRLAITGRNL